MDVIDLFSCIGGHALGLAAAGDPWHEGPPRGLRVADGASGWLDRNAAVEAIGDSNPPGMATVIGRAILRCKPQDIAA